MTDPLENLVVDGETVNRNLLYETLKSFIRIIRETKQFEFTAEFDLLGPKQKIIVFLLGQKAKKTLNFIEDEKTSPKTIPAEIGLPEGTVYPYMRELEEKKKLIRSESGTYYIPNYALEQAKKFLTNKTND